MRIAGLMCWNYDAAKTFKHHDALADLSAICDELFILDDASDPPLPKEFFDRYPKLQAVIRNDERNHTWNDWTNHNQLLMAAAKRGCDYVFWLDDDESLWPIADRSLTDLIFRDLMASPTASCVNLHWEHVWNSPDAIRRGGEWGRLRKPFLQKNPFSSPGCMCFGNGPSTQLHSWPIQTGAALINDSVRVLHWALMNQEDRDRYAAKYAKHDPDGKFPNFILKEIAEPNPPLAYLKDL